MPRWSTIQRLVLSRYAKLTVLVPVIGWLLIVDDQFARTLARLTGQESLSQPSWKIYALHVGLSIFGCGVALFYLLCPAAIKGAKGFTDFAETDQRTITSDQLETYNRALSDAKRQVPSAPSGGSLAFPQVTSETGRDTWLRRNQDLVLKTQFAFYELEDQRDAVLRGLVFLILLAGGILTFIPSLMTILTSVSRLAKILLG